MSQCPDCVANVAVPSNVNAGEVVFCPDCNAELEIITTDPVELALAPEIEEDWGE